MRESHMSPFLKEVIEALENTDKEVYSIHIVEEDDNTFDIRIWDERESESCEDIEEGHFNFYEEAISRLDLIISEHPDVIFIRNEDEWRTKK